LAGRSPGSTPRQFIDNDRGYLVWLREHPGGYVLNCNRHPSPDYLILHRADCWTISRSGVTYTTAYQKVCSDTADQLVKWAERETGAQPTPCRICLRTRGDASGVRSPRSTVPVGPRSGLTAAELDLLEEACRKVPLTQNEYVAMDFIKTLLTTVIDYNRHTTTVESCDQYFTERRSHEVRTLDDLEVLFDRFPNDKDGNVALARHLWGQRQWTRAEQLRGLVAFLRRIGVEDLDELRKWGTASTFKDFEGQVKGLGPVVYQWLVMRLGVPTIKPDVHVLRFCQAALGRVVSEQEAIDGLTVVATRMGVPPNVLDWSIWEYQREGVT
jgi:hypothetical protein